MGNTICNSFEHEIVPILGFENSIIGEQCSVCGAMNEELDGRPKETFSFDIETNMDGGDFIISTPKGITTQRTPSISEILVDENNKLNSGYYESENW